MTERRESSVERRLTALVERMGGLSFKWVSPGRRGVPDRIIVMPGGRVYLVEVKRPGGRPRADQLAVHRRIEKRGVSVYVVDDADAFARDVLGSDEQAMPVGVA